MTELLPQFYVKLGGSDAPFEIAQAIEEICVESSLHLPAVATLVLYDPDLAFVDHSSFALLTELKISVKAGSRSSETTLFDGEIVELEPVFSHNSARLIVRAFDRLHKLTRGQHARTFQNVTDSDLVSKIAGECGLSASATATTEVHKHCFQANQSNLDFLRRRLARVGHLLSVDGKTLKSGPPAANPAVSLSWGTDMIEFRPRMSVSSYTTDVSVRSWDMKTKKAIVGKATTSDGLVPAIGATSGRKPSLTSELLISDCTVNTQAEATSLAKSYLQHRNSEYVEAEGTTLGNAKIKAGEQVEIQNVGTRFSGTYLVTAATHRYTAEEGYSTDFSVTGLKAGIIQDLVGVPAEANTLATGMMTGLITNNKDPEKYGRVKVKFPWLSEEDESDWLRVVVPGGGNNRGLLFLPEVNDEVLVGFEQGDINRPYVLGGLWNGQDATICVDNTTVKAGKVEQRLIVSRTGHKIVIDDSSDKGGILITDKNGNKIELAIKDDSLTISTKGNITITSQKNLTVQTTQKLTLDATGDLELKSKGNLKLEAVGDVSIKATKNLTAEGILKAELKGTTGVTVQSPAITEVKGSMVKLN